eukprot:3795796-Rhodomonas_salina.2
MHTRAEARRFDVGGVLLPLLALASSCAHVASRAVWCLFGAFFLFLVSTCFKFIESTGNDVASSDV